MKEETLESFEDETQLRNLLNLLDTEYLKSLNESIEKPNRNPV